MTKLLPVVLLQIFTCPRERLDLSLLERVRRPENAQFFAISAVEEGIPTAGLCRETGKSQLSFNQEKPERGEPQLPASPCRLRQRGCCYWELLPSAVTQNRGKSLI